MRAIHRSFRSFDEFEREELRAGEGPGWNFDRFVEQVTVDGDDYHFVEGADLLIGDELDDDSYEDGESDSDED